MDQIRTLKEKKMNLYFCIHLFQLKFLCEGQFENRWQGNPPKGLGRGFCKSCTQSQSNPSRFKNTSATV